MKSTELDHYRERLVAMGERLRAEVEELDEAIAGEGRDPGDLSRVPTHSADHDSEGLGVEEAMERNQVALLNAVEAALGRIEAGDFGRCGECGAVIPSQRLNAIPYAAFCVDCERARE